MAEKMNEKAQITDLQYELSITLEALLYYAGVKKHKLESAVDAYIECIDEVLENSDLEGVDEIIAVIDYLKKFKHELFV